MMHTYSSVFASDIVNYIDLLREEGRYICKIQSSLWSLDKYLVNCDLKDKSLEADTIASWVKMRDVGAVTKANDISHIKGFARYLTSLGLEASCPDMPKSQSNYVPYIFSDTEIERMFSVADNFEATKHMTNSVFMFPVLLRILYGCGLRLGEGLSLRWKDVDLDNGVLTIAEAKNRKQRFIPLDTSTTTLLRRYSAITQTDSTINDYLFESSRIPGKPFRSHAFQAWFTKVLAVAGIHYIRRAMRERGPCPHCLRHCFTLKSFLKSECEGRRFEDTAPFLAAYLGHDGPTGTERYLSTNYLVYTQSHQRIGAAIRHLFPEVCFDEE